MRHRLGHVAAASLLAACTSAPDAPTTVKPFKPASLTPDRRQRRRRIPLARRCERARARHRLGETAERKDRSRASRPIRATNPSAPRPSPSSPRRTARPRPTFRAEGIDNFWQDAANRSAASGATPRSRATSSGAPKWQTVLDIDALSKRRERQLDLQGAPTALAPPKPAASSVSPMEARTLSSSASSTPTRPEVLRPRTASTSPKASTASTGSTPTRILVATDFGPGTLTESGYPYIVKTLKRGQTMAQRHRSLSRLGHATAATASAHMSIATALGKVLAAIITRPLDTFRSGNLRAGRRSSPVEALPA
jgi:hypothetical protein